MILFFVSCLDELPLQQLLRRLVEPALPAKLRHYCGYSESVVFIDVDLLVGAVDADVYIKQELAPACEVAVLATLVFMADLFPPLLVLFLLVADLAAYGHPCQGLIDILDIEVGLHLLLYLGC